MDLITGLLCFTVAIASAVVIYVMSMSTMKEKTYDEVLAEKKKKAEEYLSQGRLAKDKAKDKKLKKAGKKVKEKSNVDVPEVSSEDTDSSRGHVAFMEPATIAGEDLPLIDDIRKKRNKKKKKEKTILVNKNEPSIVVDVPPLVINHFEKIVPKDDCELKRSHSREEVVIKNMEDTALKEQTQPQKQTRSQSKTQGSSQKGEHKNEKQNQQKGPEKQEKTEKQNTASKQEKQEKVYEEKKSVEPSDKLSKLTSKLTHNAPQTSHIKPQQNIPPSAAAKQVQSAPQPATGDQSNASPSSKSSKKKKSELATLQQMSGEREGVNINLLMPLVRKAELSRSEIQVLIDVLLNKQQSSNVELSEWIEGRQDPMVKLKKQLSEKEKALSDEQEAAVALQNKLKELRTELNAEKHTARQLEEGLHAKQSEISGLATRLQHSAEEKQTLAQQIQQLQSKLSEEHMILRELQEEKGQAQNAMQQELLAQRQQLELHIARLTEQHQETMASMEAQLDQLATQLQEQEALNASLNNDLSLLRERGVHLQDSAVHSQDLARQVKELHSELERVLTSSQFEGGRLQGEISSLNEQLNKKRAEIEKLSNAVQNMQAENQRLRETNDCLTHQVSSACVKAQQLRDENETLAAQVTASMERPATEGRENGDAIYTENKHIVDNQDILQEKELLVEKLKTDLANSESTVEQLTNEIKTYKAELMSQETIVKQLNADVERFKKDIERLNKELKENEPLKEKESFVDALTSEINAYKEKLNEKESLVQTLNKDIDNYKLDVSQLSDNLIAKEKQTEEKFMEKLTVEIETYKKEIAAEKDLVAALTADVDRYKSDIENLSKQLSNADESKEAVIEELNSTITKLKTELESQKSDVESIENCQKEYEEEISRLRKELAANEVIIEKLSNEVNLSAETNARLTQERDSQKQKNDELRTKNWKVMEALSGTEKSLETKVKQSQRLVNDAVKEQKTKEQLATRQFLIRVFPQVVIDDSLKHEEWLEQFSKCVKELQAQRQSESVSEDQAAMLTELEKQNAQLQAMVTHYKSIIADTEGMLNRLQNHVEQEEGRWGQQLQALESQLEAVMLERDRLEENSELASQLEAALNVNREQHKEIARLKALVQIGEDSYKEEHKQVQQLQQEVADLLAVEGSKTTNGVTTSVTTACQTLRKRRRFSGWIWHKITPTRMQRRHSGNASA